MISSSYMACRGLPRASSQAKAKPEPKAKGRAAKAKPEAKPAAKPAAKRKAVPPIAKQHEFLDKALSFECCFPRVWGGLDSVSGAKEAVSAEVST